jgi:hypothetical protein
MEVGPSVLRSTSQRKSLHISLEPLKISLEDSLIPSSLKGTSKPFYVSIVKLVKIHEILQTQLQRTSELRHETNTMSSTQKSPERGFALQKYLLLHSQHDALQKHLNQITNSFPTASQSQSPDRTRHASLSSSPGSSDEGMYLSSPVWETRNHRHGGNIRSSRRPALKQRRSSLPTVVDESILGEIEQDEMKLKEVNQNIKTTLTELLNCESVRGDRRYRMWIQTRLMDAEKELKQDRSKSCDRRRSEDASGMMW